MHRFFIPEFAVVAAVVAAAVLLSGCALPTESGAPLDASSAGASGAAGAAGADAEPAPARPAHHPAPHHPNQLPVKFADAGAMP